MIRVIFPSPAEFVKIGLILFFSWYFNKYQEKINKVSVLGIAALLFAVPAFMILEQPNLSTTLVTTVIIASIVFCSGVSYKWILGVLAVVVPSTVLFIYLLSDYGKYKIRLLFRKKISILHGGNLGII